MAWQAVKARLVRGVSIGFRALGYEPLETGGLKFTETEIYELSLVTIPANASATIQTIKSMDRKHLEGAVKLIRARDVAIKNGAVSLR
jgi:HK97 family phage prohead protease